MKVENSEDKVALSGDVIDISLLLALVHLLPLHFDMVSDGFSL